MSPAWIDSLLSARVYDLEQLRFAGMPIRPSHKPGYFYALHRRRLDTFDPKPDAPAEVRGEYGTIPTAAPSVRLCEHLPRLARLTDRLALVRGLHHPCANTAPRRRRR